MEPEVNLIQSLSEQRADIELQRAARMFHISIKSNYKFICHSRRFKELIFFHYRELHENAKYKR